MSVVTIKVPENAVMPVKRGHPWLFRDIPIQAEAGNPCILVDRNGDKIGWGVTDEGDIRVRVLDNKVPGQLDVPRLLKERIRRAEQLRTRFFIDGTDCYRVVNGEGDGIPGLIIDRYDWVCVVRVYAKAWVRYLPDIIEAIELFGWVGSIVRKLGVERVDGSKGLEHLSMSEAPETLVVTERQMKLLVQPGKGQKTGMFLDQREHRDLVRQWSAGRMVENLFSYHGGFSVAAALGGAARVVSVDIAPRAIEDAKENFRLNGLDPDHHGFEVADCFAYRPKGKVDMLIVDPPSLAKGARSAGAARNAYRKLHRNLANHVSRDGLMASASCTARMTHAEWVRAVEEGLITAGLWSWLWTSQAPVDHPTAMWHPEGRYLKFGLLRRRT